MAKRKTHEEFVREISIKNPNIDILSQYVNSRNKIHCKCRVCNHEWDVLPTSLSRGIGCPICGIEKIRQSLSSDTETFLRKLSLVNNDVVITSEYVSAHDKICCKCKICENDFKMKPNALLNGQGCPTCADRRRKESQLLPEQKFLDKLKINNPNVTPLESYQGRHRKILCHCNVHNYNWKTRPAELMKGHGCPKCYAERIGNVLKLSQEEFEEKLRDKNSNIILIGKYINSKTPIECQCKKCGHIWSPLPNNLLYGKVTGCPKCQSYSKGEDAIKECLDVNNISYEIHKTYKDLIGVGGKLLSYDFYIPHLNLLIEYQGQQHERPTSFGNISIDETIEKFKIQQEHDKRKREYANIYNIDLLEIWYWDYKNIEQILSRKLNINNNQKSA